ncbi:CrcB family protein [Actinomadura darangshiensis]|uniref:Fluoride-specific ion channel FluC n=2 Tax=Actinomadura darangshiensis TaxID=705336 RepID=A0A4R5BDV4_9ACTN|nr:CrcB family protein [Actinomadura darangshiensis]TDD84411.1 CrcB family protein [Actinomadura darangshiensis]
MAVPVDPDVDLHVPLQRRELRRRPWTTLAAISVGGVCGTLARYGLSTAFPHPPGAFDWATFGINVSGCLLIGVLMVLIAEVWQVHRLVRPFLGVGVLGGFTTFSTAIVEVQQGVEAGAARTALVYMFATLFCALVAVFAGVRGTRLLSRFALRRGKERR